MAGKLIIVNVSCHCNDCGKEWVTAFGHPVKCSCGSSNVSRIVNGIEELECIKVDIKVREEN